MPERAQDRVKSPSFGPRLARWASLVTLVALAITLAAGTAFAESSDGESRSDELLTTDADDYWRTGPYVQGSFVQAWGHFDDPVTPSGLGMQLAVGGRFTRYIAGELDYEGVYTWTIKGVDTSTYAAMANVKGYLPLGGIGPIKSVQPFAIGGLGWLAEQKGNSFISRFAYRLGAGADVYLNEWFYLSLAYRYTGNLDDFGYSNILYGIGYKFD